LCKQHWPVTACNKPMLRVVELAPKMQRCRIRRTCPGPLVD